MILFAALCIALMTLLFLPGLLVLAPMRMPSSIKLATAPLGTVLALVMVGIVLDLTVGAVSGYVPIAIVLAMAVGIHLVERKFLGTSGFERRDLVALAKGVCPYLLVGVAVTTYMFCMALPSADAYAQVWDNLPHLGMVKSMSYGRFSILRVSYFLEPGTAAFNPTGTGGFYPAAFHILAALLVNCLGVKVAVAMNVLLACIMGVLFPISAYAFLDVLSDHNARLTLAGSVVTLAFGTFPWRFLFWGPLYPNMMAFCLVFAVASQFLWLCRPYEGRVMPLAILVFVASVGALGSIHPNAVFLLGVILAPMVLLSLLREVPAFLAGRVKDKMANRVLLALAFVVLAVVAWVVAYNADFMSGVVSYVWSASTPLLEAVQRVATMAFVSSSPQYLLMTLALVGFVRALAEPSYAWLDLSFVICALLYVIDAAIDGPVRQLLTGFWYTDVYRTAACAAIAAIPLVALGIDTLLALVVKLFGELVGESFRPADEVRVVGCVLLVLFYALYFPVSFASDYDAGDTQAGAARIAVCYVYDLDVDANSTLTRQETEFLDRVHEVTSDGGMILNIPQDGSAWGFANNDLRLLFRTYGSTDLSDEVPEARLLRSSCYQIATNPEVRAAAEALDVRYVLLLDQKTWGKEGVNLNGYDPETWNGLFGITPDTPGFEVVLQDEDMVLYRICD